MATQLNKILVIVNFFPPLIADKENIEEQNKILISYNYF